MACTKGRALVIFQEETSRNTSVKKKERLLVVHSSALRHTTSYGSGRGQLGRLQEGPGNLLQPEKSEAKIYLILL